jgi:hypothetical protein
MMVSLLNLRMILCLLPQPTPLAGKDTYAASGSSADVAECDHSSDVPYKPLQRKPTSQDVIHKITNIEHTDAAIFPNYDDFGMSIRNSAARLNCITISARC